MVYCPQQNRWAKKKRNVHFDAWLQSFLVFAFYFFFDFVFSLMNLRQSTFVVFLIFAFVLLRLLLFFWYCLFSLRLVCRNKFHCVTMAIVLYVFIWTTFYFIDCVYPFLFFWFNVLFRVQLLFHVLWISITAFCFNPFRFDFVISGCVRLCYWMMCKWKIGERWEKTIEQRCECISNWWIKAIGIKNRECLSNELQQKRIEDLILHLSMFYSLDRQTNRRLDLVAAPRVES